MKYLIITLLVLYLLCAASPVYALHDTIQPSYKGARVNSHVDTKPAQSCHKWTSNGWIIEIDNYFIQDGQNSESNYQDYLSDFNHYFTQYPRTCKIAPIPL